MGASDGEYEDIMDCEVEKCEHCGKPYEHCDCNEDYW